MSRHRAGKRPWLAVVLAVVYPGLGHLYLRKWLRALAWFLLIFTTTALTLPQSALPDSGGLSLDSVMAASRALPIEAVLAILVLTALSMVDAYRIARQPASTASGATSSGGSIGDAIGVDGDEEVTQSDCPHCGRETDTDLDFCQWCSKSLDTDPS